MEAYVAGRLDDAEAARFEEHYFACEACWAEVERAFALRATFAGMPAVASSAPRRSWMLAGLLAASLAAVALLGTWALGVHPPWSGGRATPNETVWRGAGALALEARSDGTTLHIAWRPDANAASYAVEVTAGDGSLRWRAETAATQVEFARAKLEPAAGGPWRVEVRALDALGNVVGESEAVRLENAGGN